MLRSNRILLHWKTLKDETELISGCGERLKDMVCEPNNQMFLKEIELRNSYRIKDDQRRQLKEIRKDIIETPMMYVNDHFEMDEELTKFYGPFIKFYANADDIRKVNEIFASNLSLATLDHFNSLFWCKWNNGKNKPLSTKIKNLNKLEKLAQFDCVAIVFCRIKSNTPQKTVYQSK